MYLLQVYNRKCDTGEWDWSNLSEHIDMKYVRENPLRPWCRQGLSRNKGLTVDDIDNLVLPYATGDWDWEYISDHIDIREVRANPLRSWNIQSLSRNRGLTVHDVDLLSIGAHMTLYRDTLTLSA